MQWRNANDPVAIQQLPTPTPAPAHAPVATLQEEEFVWSYGVTTTSSRRSKLLPRTLESLRRAGFERPHLFVDGDCDGLSWSMEFNLPVTCRDTRILIHGNWMLALHELYIREPYATRYVVFQDDFVTYVNLRQYLEAVGMPADGYCNLYTYPHNELKNRDRSGWCLSNQKGLGAIALMFSNEQAIKLLTHPTMIDRPKHIGDKGNGLNRGWRFVDGGIITAFKGMYKEYVHMPSLTYHTGVVSTVNKSATSDGGESNPHTWGKGCVTGSFKGEKFDAMKLLRA